MGIKREGLLMRVAAKPSERASLPPTVVSSLVVFVALLVSSLAIAPRVEAFIYWSDDDAIGRANLDGTGVDHSFIESAAGVGPVGVAVDASSVFWTRPTGCWLGATPDGLGRANLDGTGVNEFFITAAVECGGAIAVDANYVYWHRSDGSLDDASATISRASLDGSVIEPDFIVRNGFDVGCGAGGQCYALIEGLAVDAGHVYWTEGQYPFTSTISRANIDGTGTTILATGIGDAREGLAVDADHIYWSTGNTIGRSNLDGTGVDRQWIDAKSPVGVAVDANHVYWSEFDFRRSYRAGIARANLDGSKPERNFIADVSGHSLAVDENTGVGTDTGVGTASARKTQKQHGNKIRVKVKVKAYEDLEAKASGKIKVGKRSYKLKSQSKSVSGGQSKTLKLKPKKSKDARKIAKALKRGKGAKAKLEVKLSDEAGNKKTTKLSVRLKR